MSGTLKDVIERALNPPPRPAVMLRDAPSGMVPPARVIGQPIEERHKAERKSLLDAAFQAGVAIGKLGPSVLDRAATSFSTIAAGAVNANLAPEILPFTVNAGQLASANVRNNRARKGKVHLELAGIAFEEKRLNEELSKHEQTRSVLREMRDFVASTPVLRPTHDSMLHHLLDAYRTGRVHESNHLRAAAPDDFWDVLQTANVFVVEHDWAAAFSSSDLTGPDWQLPFQYCCFEFTIGTHRVCAYVTDSEDGRVLVPIIKLANRWADLFPWVMDGDHWRSTDSLITEQDPIIEMIGANIRAACVALEAEVITHEVTRASVLLNEVRARKNQAPLKDFHVLSLARRNRAAPAGEVNPTGRRVRLHWRRGHWRHYETCKTWIKWMLVGDPDLGFVDKHYKL